MNMDIYFNTASRRVALQEVASHFPEILAWCITCYGNTSFLLFSDAQILSSSGFQQGDPLAALLFALVLQPVVLIINEEVPSLNLNSWYLDDGTLVGNLEELQTVVDILEREGPERGLILSTKATSPSDPKTTVWSPLTFTGSEVSCGRKHATMERYVAELETAVAGLALHILPHGSFGAEELNL